MSTTSAIFELDNMKHLSSGFVWYSQSGKFGIKHTLSAPFSSVKRGGTRVSVGISDAVCSDGVGPCGACVEICCGLARLKPCPTRCFPRGLKPPRDRWTYRSAEALRHPKAGTS